MLENPESLVPVRISEDLDEIFALSDRITVIFEGEIMGQATGSAASREQIGLWMSGVRA